MTLTSLLGIARGYDLTISGARVQELVKEAYALGYASAQHGNTAELDNDDPAWGAVLDGVLNGRQWHER